MCCATAWRPIAPPATCCCRPPTFRHCFPEPAAKFIAARGGRVRRGSRVEAVRRQNGQYLVDGHGPYRQVIVRRGAPAPGPPGPGLPELAPVVAIVAALRWEPIVTCYLAYPENTRLPWPMVGVDGGHAQWLFDRGALVRAAWPGRGRDQRHGPHQELDQETLALRIHEEVARHGCRPAETALDPGDRRKARHLRLHAQPAPPGRRHAPARPLAGRRLCRRRLSGHHRRRGPERHCPPRPQLRQQAAASQSSAPARNAAPAPRRGSPASASCRLPAFMSNIRSMICRAGRGIEVAGRLVGQQQPRLHGKGARQRHALLLAARQMLRIVAQRARPGRPAPASPRPVVRRSAGPTSSSGSTTFSSAVRAGSNWKDWKTKPSSRPRNAARAILVEATIDPRPPAARGPGVGSIQPRHQAQQGRLARTRKRRPSQPPRPALTAKEISCRIVSVPSPLGTSLPRCSTSIIAMLRRSSDCMFASDILAVRRCFSGRRHAADDPRLRRQPVRRLRHRASTRAGRPCWPSAWTDKRLRLHASSTPASAAKPRPAAAARLPAALEQHRPAVVILALGANDGLRGLPIDAMRAEPRRHDRAPRKQASARVLLVGMQLPPNYGPDYARQFEPPVRRCRRAKNASRCCPSCSTPIALDTQLPSRPTACIPRRPPSRRSSITSGRRCKPCSNDRQPRVQSATAPMRADHGRLVEAVGPEGRQHLDRPLRRRRPPAARRWFADR